MEKKTAVAESAAGGLSTGLSRTNAREITFTTKTRRHEDFSRQGEGIFLKLPSFVSSCLRGRVFSRLFQLDSPGHADDLAKRFTHRRPELLRQALGDVFARREVHDLFRLDDFARDVIDVAQGVGQAESALWDERGRIGRALQSLLLDRS